MKNQLRNVDWSKADKPVKFDNDAVAGENYCWGLVAQPPVVYGWKWPLNMKKTPTFPFFTWLNNNHKELLDLNIFYNN